MSKFSRIVFGIVLVFAVATACEAPAGSEGPQGPRGEAGPIGPAGEDGSMMYAGPDAPTTDIGNEGDYYLNTTTGEYYGPKDDDGWGNPIIVLMGEDGQDGADGENGQDGADGEDGSQIYSGTGAPDASLGIEGDYYLDKDSYELYGPKTNSGWGTPLNLKGADGNANVTRYIFPGHDFSADPEFSVLISLDGDDVNESAWLAYIVNVNGWKFQISGQAYGSEYKFYHSTGGGQMVIGLVDGPGEVYDPIEIIRIETSETVDNRKHKGDSIIPDDLNTSDYEAIAEYYGFYK